MKIGGKATSVDVKSETEITAVTPSRKSGAAEVVVTDENGSSASGPNFTFAAVPAHAVASLQAVRLACTGEVACKGKLTVEAPVPIGDGTHKRSHLEPNRLGDVLDRRRKLVGGRGQADHRWAQAHRLGASRLQGHRYGPRQLSAIASDST